MRGRVYGGLVIALSILNRQAAAETPSRAEAPFTGQKTSRIMFDIASVYRIAPTKVVDYVFLEPDHGQSNGKYSAVYCQAYSTLQKTASLPR